MIPAWNISPIKKTSDVNKVKSQPVQSSKNSLCPSLSGFRLRLCCCSQAPQFVDIPLAEEDSSDEEYRPDEEDEDETAEDVRLLSDWPQAVVSLGIVDVCLEGH